MKINSIFLYALMGTAILLQVFLLFAGGLEYLSGLDHEGHLLNLQGKQEYLSAGAGSIREIRPAEPGTMAQVPGLMPGEGQDYPPTPQKTRPVHPLLMELQQTVRTGFIPGDGDFPGIRLLVFHFLLLEWNEPLSPDREQSAELLKTIEKYQSARQARRNFVRSCLAVLTPEQWQWIETRCPWGHPDEELPVLTGRLLDYLENNRGIQQSPGGELPRGRMDVSRLLWGIMAMDEFRDAPALSREQKVSLRGSLARFHEALIELPPPLEFDKFFTASQRDYVRLCFSDRAFMDRMISSYVMSPGTEPVAGVNRAKYYYLLEKLKENIPGEVAP